MLSVSFLWNLTATLILLILISSVCWSLLQNQKKTSQTIQELLQENKRLTNLITSKDPMTFSTLQTLTTNNVVATPMPFDGMPGDDASVAHAIAERYKKAGLDPAAAYDDPETALQDFNLKDFGF